ncbi:ATPase family AAA domain-containing protein 2-like [Podargus strigoides]
MASHRDRRRIGAGLADVDPVQTDCLVRFDGVGGLSGHISALKEMVILPLLYPEFFERFKIQPPRGCLFYGPPGTGKTLVAHALANEYSQGDRRIAFFMRKGADCLSEWVGESERQLCLLFDQAYQMRPSIIFFDEIDGLAPARTSKQDHIYSSIVSTLLALMDGLDSRGEIVVIGATNRLDSIDPALRRPGRFDQEFRFSLPNKEARKEIFKIHTQSWSPKPLDTFLEELAEQCAGYCGADIKSLCAEAALCALHRRYPQIYESSEKVQIDIASVEITAQDFVTAMQKTVRASQRAVASPGQALSAISKPLLENTLAGILQALQGVFPHAELALKKDQQQDSLNHAVRNDAIDGDDESPSIFEEKPTQEVLGRPKEQFLSFSRNVYYQPLSCRPRFLLAEEPGYGQASQLARAVIHALEKFPVYSLDLSILLASVTSAEATCVQLMREAERTAPSLIYIPHIQLWWEAVGAPLKAIFTTRLRAISPFAPVLLLATSGVCHADLPEEVKKLFNENSGEVFTVQLPGEEERRAFFADLFLNQAAKPPAKSTAWQPLEVLPLAPPPAPRQLTDEQIRQLEEQEDDTLRELRIFLQDVTHRLVVDRRFRAFTKPVDPQEVPDYDTVIKQPMDLSSVLSKIDRHQYLTARDFLKDMDLICSNALKYYPDKAAGDRLLRHRACTLRDTAYAIVREEMDKDLEQHCEEIQASRKKRGCNSSKCAPSYYHVIPKTNSVPGCEKMDPKCNEKTKMPAAPVDSSTPCLHGFCDAWFFMPEAYIFSFASKCEINPEVIDLSMVTKFNKESLKIVSLTLPNVCLALEVDSFIQDWKEDSSPNAFLLFIERDRTAEESHRFSIESGCCSTCSKVIACWRKSPKVSFRCPWATCYDFITTHTQGPGGSRLDKEEGLSCTLDLLFLSEGSHLQLLPIFFLMGGGHDAVRHGNEERNCSLQPSCSVILDVQVLEFDSSPENGTSLNLTQPHSTEPLLTRFIPCSPVGGLNPFVTSSSLSRGLEPLCDVKFRFLGTRTPL